MLRKTITLIPTLFLFLALLAAGPAAAQSDDMAGMNMSGDMIMLQGDTRDGVKAMVHLRDIHEAMAKMGMAQTHHFMVMFTGADGRPVAKGMAAVKITGPDGRTAKPLRLMAMDNSFGADVVLKDKGTYRFEVGTKLADGKKRTFRFHHTVQ